MKNELRKSARFILILSIVTIVSFCVQVLVFSFPPHDHLLLEAYFFNGVFAVLAFISLLIVNRKQPGFTGFAFMASSAIKFLIFLSVFYPVYYQDGGISQKELLSFFVPYSICLVTELFVFVKY